MWGKMLFINYLLRKLSFEYRRNLRWTDFYLEKVVTKFFIHIIETIKYTIYNYRDYINFCNDKFWRSYLQKTLMQSVMENKLTLA